MSNSLTDKLDIMLALLKELERAEAKHPEWPTDPLHAISVINEEAGELTQAALDYYYGDDGYYGAMEREAVQVGAMAIRFLIHICNYDRKKMNPPAPGL